MPISPRRIMGALPQQRWLLPPIDLESCDALRQALGCPASLAEIYLRRGLTTPEAVQAFLEPETLALPPPQTVFPDLDLAVELLQQAIARGDKMTICGDYDADGMTSTALLLRALRHLGADIDYEIPSRMQEGYGLNERIVQDCYERGVKLILTVDNGIAAHQPILKARELGLTVIVTDHHDVPEQLPPAHAILNPKLVPPASPYHTLAGVGMAYTLALSLAQRLGNWRELVRPLRELCTLGTIADLAPLMGVNRRWVKQGLQTIPTSSLVGVQALMQMAGCLPAQNTALKPTAVGFRLGPRINAIGRIGDPQVVIDLLTTEDPQRALELATLCEETNRRRQELCAEIERQAIAHLEETGFDPQQEWVLVIVQPDWHHGVIGIVASRLVERYGVPVFIGTYEDETTIRGSIRSIPEFHVFEALEATKDLLLKYGGHRAAGGFSLRAEHLATWRDRLRAFAQTCLKPEDLRPLVTLDAEVSFEQLTWDFYAQVEQLQPFGSENPQPIFCSRGVKILEQAPMGQQGEHLQLTLEQNGRQMTAKAWRWGQFFPLPTTVDIAYHLTAHTWNGETQLELELKGVKPSLAWYVPNPPSHPLPHWQPLPPLTTLLPQLRDNVLLYGYGRPEVPPNLTTAAIHYDRPRDRCRTLILWSLPPSATHLRWLLAIAQPEMVYVGCQRPAIAPLTTLILSIQNDLKEQTKVNLLALSQTYWIAPCTLVAILRHLGYGCEGFAPTLSITAELTRLQRWYQLQAKDLARLAQRWETS
ncbi:single-stranded-DNA-specific exonuclease RecJ [Thermosynechococcus sp. PP22]|uniref:single-stranded-DNA-specific exonuclease RecJ n=1 Tax=Thermosynechococcus sp. PP22 TaxID=3074082 RepID=UPI0028737768|nr:single-stranded-DNA-specific exonuclease RecJ [Thermosynechococcus sp. PP22]WNC22055.1 single-stranded-DNA-specific exonuclease RecJ [Thermosynechococcus sp. PP22]